MGAGCGGEETEIAVVWVLDAVVEMEIAVVWVLDAVV